MSEYVIKGETLTEVADAIRTKKGITATGGAAGSEVLPIPTTSMAEEILSIVTDVEPMLQEVTVTPSTIAKTFTPAGGYDGFSKVNVNAMPAAEQATPSISVSAAGLITASATQAAGYVAAGTKAATKQLTTQAAQTITPGTSNKTIASGRYLTGTQTIKGDRNLVAGNIKKGVSIFSVTGTHEGGTTVQKKTGAFELDEYGYATVVCGFKPDCVAVFGGLHGGETVYPGAMFTEAGESLIRLMVPSGDNPYVFTVLPITQTSDGFYIEDAARFENTVVNERYRTFNYVAMKYT